MLDNSITTRPLSARKEMQEEHNITQLPMMDLCYATYILESREQLIVDVLGTDESEQIALLSYEENDQHGIWIARRDQSGTPGTWLWTDEQQETAKKNPARIANERNNFRGDKGADTPIQVAPLHKDRRVEILMLGLQLQKTDAEVQDRLRAEGLDATLPTDYRTEQGEIDLLKNWLP